MVESWNDRVARDILRVAQAIYLDAATIVDKGILAMGAVAGATIRALSVNEDGELLINLEAGDIQIGAVELKDADSAVRADIELDRAKNALFVQSELHELWNAWNRLKVSAIVGQSGIAGGAGAQSGDTIRTVAATDSPDVTALEIMDDWDFGDRAKVSAIVGQCGIAGGAGTQDVTTVRTVTATDSPDTVALERIEEWGVLHGDPVGSTVAMIGYEVKTFDGTDLPNPVQEGDAVRPAATEPGVQYVFPVNPSGSQSPYDDSNNVFRTMETNDARQQEISVQIQAATLTTSIERQIGSEINCQGFNTLTFYADYSKGTETKLTLTPSFLRASGGDEHPIGSWDAAAGSKAWTADSFDLSASTKIYMVLDVAGLNYCTISELASDNNPTGTLQLSYALSNNG